MPVAADLDQIETLLDTAVRPEDVFGQKAEARKNFRRLIRIVHPDVHPDDVDRADRTFKRVIELWRTAQRRLTQDLYGTNSDPVVIHTKNRDYTLWGAVGHGDIANLYRSSWDGGEGVFKVVRDPADNDLAVNEAMMLGHLRAEVEERYHPFFPELKASLMYEDGSSQRRRANVMDFAEGFASLADIIAAYPKGIDPRDMAWMWRRVLAALGAAHRAGVVHGAVTPPHVLVHPTGHGLVLVDWSYAVLKDDPMKALPAPYASWYPREIRKKEAPTSGLDVYMGAMSMVGLLGGDPATGLTPDSVPRQIRAYFRSCTLSATRPQDAWGLLGDFDELIERLWGRRRYRPFHMPEKES